MVGTLTFTVIFLSSLGFSVAQSARPVFNFMIERTSDMVTIPQGSGGLNTLHVTLLLGSPQDVALSAGRLPHGVTLSFADNTVRFDREGGHPPYGSTYSMYISTSASTPSGTYPVTITATGGGVSRSMNFMLKIVPVTGTKVYYVSPSGNDRNNGSVSAPFRTLQKAADVVAPGNTVVVRAGEYHERIRIKTSGTQGSPITFLGEPGAVINGAQTVSGWEPAPEMATGVFKKSVGSMPFDPGSISWNDKYSVYILEFSPGDDVGNAFQLLSLPMGHFRMEAMGAVGYTDPDTSTAYLRLKTNADPDGEDIELAPRDVATVDLDSKSWNVIRGFTLRNGMIGVYLRNGSSNNVIEHNRILGGQYSVNVLNAANNQIRNNEITLNHHFNDHGHPINVTQTEYFIYLLLRKYMKGHQKHIAVSLDGADNTQVYENHIYRHFSGVIGHGDTVSNQLRIYRNYIHHVDGYSLQFKTFGDTTWIHDNILYENTENCRIDHIPHSSVIYYYRNRMALVSRVACNCVYVLSTDPSHSDMTIPSTQATVYIYHNSFTGGTNIAWSLGGAPNVWVVNNILSATQSFVYEDNKDPGMHFNYNWVGGAEAAIIVNWHKKAGGRAHNLASDNQRMWDLINPSFQPAPSARSIGIDLSKSWGFKGVTNPALPGMVPGYFSGSAPDAGVFQFATPTPPPPRGRGRHG